MTNPLPFAESFLCWQLICYGFGADMVHYAPPENASRISVAARLGARPGTRLRWIATALIGALWASLLAWAVGWDRTGLTLAAVVLSGSILVPLIRRLWITSRFLAEFEAGSFAAFALCLWQICRNAPEQATGLPMGLPLTEGWSANRQAAACILAALFLFAVRGGSLIVLGILEKAGGVPLQARPASDASNVHTPGEMIGYIERAIVLLIVAAGNLQALAFFFVAKGLARSKKLDDDPIWANYFVLGSLASFFLALVCGLLGQATLTLLWK
jgi:hypothetical protein